MVQVPFTEEVPVTAPPEPPAGPLETWGLAFDIASAQLADHVNPLETYEFSDLRALHDINIIQHDGAVEYEDKCQELAIAALTAVKAGLGSEHANLAHCRLSRKGAHALAHALACNVNIQRLTLQSNHIDGVVRASCSRVSECQTCKALLTPLVKPPSMTKSILLHNNHNVTHLPCPALISPPAITPCLQSPLLP